MSRIQSLLDIKVTVTDQGLGTLSKAAAAIKALGVETAKLQDQDKQSAAAVRTLRTLRTALSTKIEEEGRKKLELMRIERQLIATQQRGVTVQRNRIIAGAQLALQQGNLEKAEARLQRAMRLTNRRSIEAVRIQQLLSRVARERARRAAEVTREALKQAFAEAAVARASGETAREIQILNRILRRHNLDSRSAERATVALARAQRRQERAAERLRVRLTGLARQLAIVRALMSGAARGFNIFTRVLAAGVLIGFTIRTVGRALSRFIFRPLIEITKQILTVTDRFARLDASLLGVVGSMRAVRSLTRDIRLASEGLPVTALEATAGIRGLAFTAGTARIISTEGPQRAQQINEILRILTGLATIDPEQGIPGARFAVREALAGEVRSLRFRFELSPQVIAATIGKSLEEVKADPALMLKALSKFVDVFIGDQAIEQFQKLLSVQGDLLRGAIEEFLLLIGQQGLFDQVVDTVRNLASNIKTLARQTVKDGVVTPAPGTLAARLINNSLTGLLDTTIKALALAIENITGITVDISDNLNNLDLESLSRALAQIIDRLAQFAAGVIVLLPLFATAAEKLIPGEFGPITPESIKARLVVLRRKRESISAFEDPGLADELSGVGPGERAFGGGVAIAAAISRFTGRLKKTEDEIERMEKRLAIFNKILAVFEPFGDSEVDRIKASVNEFGKSFSRIGIELDQVTKGVPSIPDVTTLGGSFNKLFKAVNLIFDPNTPGSFQAQLNAQAEFITQQADNLFERIQTQAFDEAGGDPRVVKARGFQFGAIALEGQSQSEKLRLLAEAIALLEDPTKDMIAIMEELKRSFEQTGIATDTVRTILKEKLQGIIAGSEGFTRQEAPLFRVRQGADILGLLGAQQPEIVREILASERAREARAAQPSGFVAEFRAIQPQAGITRGEELLDPGFITSIARTINNVENSIANITDDTRLGAEAADDYRQQFIKLLETTRTQLEVAGEIKRVLGATIGPEGLILPKKVADPRIELISTQLEKLREDITETTSHMEDEFADAANSISQAFGSSLTDGIVAAFEEGTSGAVNVMEILFKQIQKIILRMIIEFTILRAFVNPFLNSAFGLTGSNVLPVNAAMGKVFGAGGVRSFQSGGFITSGPTTFGLPGGQTALIGEESPEVVLPLEQDASGRLGVAGIGGGGGKSIVINMIIKTPDVQNFRKSSRQLVGEMRRAAGF